MARWEFKLPDIGEGVTEGEIVAWLVSPGDEVEHDQPVVEVMTDKATVTITAPKAGKVLETRGRVGETIPVHAVLVVFELDEEPAQVTARGAPLANGTIDHAPSLHSAVASGVPGVTGSGVPGAAATRAVAIRTPAPESAGGALGHSDDVLPGLHAAGGSGAMGPAGVGAYFNDKPLATPATRRLARERNVDLKRVPPSGPSGRVTKRDVDAFAQVDPAQPAALPGSSADTDPMGGTSAGLHAPGALREDRVPMAGVRRRIAQKMALSKSTAAHFTFVEECDASELKSLRGRLKPLAEERGVKLSFLPFIVKAVVASLRRHPMLNASVDDATNEIVFRRYYNIGVATATDAGLLVPVVKDADQKGLLDIARDIDRMASDARAGKAKFEDLQGSTFTITSLGAQSGLLATPIINFPEVAILGVHRIKERPVVKDGQIVIGEVMLLSLSFDHRIVDGHVGAAFAYEVIAYLEHPDRLLLEMA
ncbi:MAG: dihydrolipoamide acetyltransferase family protein [Polyangiaceae bacterium]|jgi:pyruvate dehydrogenase E2 component (dihydrolipoamide acetyltransferase)